LADVLRFSGTERCSLLFEGQARSGGRGVGLAQQFAEAVSGAGVV